MPDVVHRGVKLRYTVRREGLGELAPRFVELGADAATLAWIEDCFRRPVPPWALAARAIARSVMSDYDANGTVGTHDMRVLGVDQWKRVLEQEARRSPAGAEGGALQQATAPRLLDVGAGDGAVTAELAPLADAVVATETSAAMVRRLRRRGYEAHEVDLATHAPPFEGPIDLIALLNVLDRTTYPLTLLERLRTLLAEEGHLLVAVPFPLAPHVHAGPLTVDPEELLPVEGSSWEAQARTLVEHVFAPSGYVVDALSRAPYLCRGGARQPVFALDDAIFVLRRR